GDRRRRGPDLRRHLERLHRAADLPERPGELHRRARPARLHVGAVHRPAEHHGDVVPRDAADALHLLRRPARPPARHHPAPDRRAVGAGAAVAPATRSISPRRFGSAMSSIPTIFASPMVKRKTTRGRPPGIHTAPANPLTSAGRAPLARRAKSATSFAPRISGTVPILTAASSARSTASGSGPAGRGAKSPLRADRKQTVH